MTKPSFLVRRIQATSMSKAFHLLSNNVRSRYFSQIAFTSLSSIIELTTLLVIYKFFEVLRSHDDSQEFFEVKIFEGSLELTLLNLYIFVFLYLLFGLAIRVTNQLRLHSLTKATEDELAKKFYRKFFSQKFSWHKENNSAEVVKSVMQDANLLTSGFYIASVNLLSNLLIVIGLVSIFLYINFWISLYVLLSALSFYILLRVSTKNKLKVFGEIKAISAANRYKNISESVKALHEIYVDDQLDLYESRFSNHTATYTSAQRGYLIISSVPTMFVESASLIAITLFGIFIVDEAVSPEVLTQLMFGIVCATRLIPAVNRIFQSRSTITFTSILIEQNTKMGDYKIGSVSEIPFSFSKEITLKQASYAINGERLCPAITFNIPRGERILIKGKSGSGKSTLIELICGLLFPTEGSVLIDGNELNENLVTSWQAQISYLPQRPHIKDATVLENIKLGTETIPPKELEIIVKLLDLRSIPGGIDRSCGEDGVAISGGQRQRIALARSLLSNKSIIIMDEATSSLDSVAEIEVLKNVFRHKKDATFICISHRTDVDSFFDKVIDMGAP